MPAGCQRQPRSPPAGGLLTGISDQVLMPLIQPVRGLPAGQGGLRDAAAHLCRDGTGHQGRPNG